MGSVKMESWERGITDDYEDAPTNYGRMLNNLLLNRRGKPTQRPGLRLFGATGIAQLPSGNQKIDGVYYFDSTVFVKSGTKLYYAVDGATSYTTLAAAGSHDAFVDSELGAKWSVSEWKGHLFITPHPGSTKKSGCRTVMVYRASGGAWTCVQAGLPRLSSATAGGLNVESSGDDNVLSYEMFYRSYVAQVDGVNVTFEDYGTPVEWKWSYVNIATCEDGNWNWTNGALQDYDDTNMKIRVFRTKTNELAALYSAQFNQGSTITFLVADDDLGEEAYFEGGVQYWDPIPLCFYSMIIDDTGFAVGGTDVDSGQVYNTRLWQSHPGNPKAYPSGNFLDVPVKYQGADHIGSYPIVFGRKSMFRIEGRFDAFGGGALVAKPVSRVHGCIAADAIVRVTGGLLFPSEQGWCFTDGFDVKLLCPHLRDTYKALVSKSGMAGCFDSKNERAYWSVEDDALDATNTGNPNAMYVLDMNHGADGEGCFTTLTGHPTYATLSATALHYDSANDRVIVGDRRGFLLKFDDTAPNDVGVSTTVTAASWTKVPIVWSLKTVAMAFGSSLLTKWSTQMHIVAKNLGASFSLDLSTQIDDSTAAYASKEVRLRNTVPSGLHKIWRWFHKGSIRCRYRQVNLTKGFVNLFRSDDYALATVNTAAKTVLLASGTWPDDNGLDLVSHSIAFAADGYVAEYLITVDSGNTLTLATAPAGNPAGTKWVVRGYPKWETCELTSLEVEFELEQDQVPGFKVGDTNANQ